MTNVNILNTFSKEALILMLRDLMTRVEQLEITNKELSKELNYSKEKTQRSIPINKLQELFCLWNRRDVGGYRNSQVICECMEDLRKLFDPKTE